MTVGSYERGTWIIHSAASKYLLLMVCYRFMFMGSGGGFYRVYILLRNSCLGIVMLLYSGFG